MGRYYAMDRDKRLERTEVAFNLLTKNTAEFRAENSEAALEAAYLRGETDEFVKPTLINHTKINPDDSIIFMNFRSDRARQLTHMFLDHGYSHFVSLTMYADTLKTKVAFPPQILKNTLPEYLSSVGLKQLHIAETEKYAHVTFFFNAGREAPFVGEERMLIPSPKDVPTYDLKPEMSAFEVARGAREKLETQTFDFLLMNFANADMVGHTGNYEAAVRAIEVLDKCVAEVVGAAEKNGYHTLITADHGNAEEMCDHEGHIHTQHTLNPVPAIWVAPNSSLAPKTARQPLRDGGLADIMPTICDLMRLEIPSEVTGKSLIQGKIE